MTDESELTTNPTDLNSISPKPGWQTSEGQIVGIITAVFGLLAIIGFHYTPEQVNSWVDLVHSIFVVLGPIIGIAITLWPYIISRGKQKSNAINATALVNVAQLGGFGSLLGGKNWKDPSRYINIIKTAGELGVPGVGVINKALNSDEDDFKEKLTSALDSIDARLRALESK